VSSGLTNSFSNVFPTPFERREVDRFRRWKRSMLCRASPVHDDATLEIVAKILPAGGGGSFRSHTLNCRCPD
jgi:hypothetical protein